MFLRSFVTAGGALALAAAVPGCTLMAVGSEDEPARLESRGLIDGHAAVGIRDEDELIRVDLFDGESDGALCEIVLWKLFRLEVGALGVGVGVGPFDLALGTFFYEPELPRMQSEAREASTSTTSSVVDDCEICARNRGE